MSPHPISPMQYWPHFTLLILLLMNGCTSISQKPTISDPNPQLPPTTQGPCTSYYTVSSGETLYGIAARCGLNPQDVARWNSIPPPYSVNPGQTLVLFGPPETTPTTPTYPTVDNTTPEPTQSSDPNYHIVMPGDTLFALSKRYGTSVGNLKAWNNLSSDNLSVGQRLRVTLPPGGTPQPVVSPATTTPVAPPSTTSSGKDYIVRPGDTLYSIAQLYGYSVTDIAGWNSLSPPYQLAVGQVLAVSPPSSVSNHTSSPLPSSGYHTVQAGDTLYSIAKRYGSDVEALKIWNNLASDSLNVGQQLKVTSSGNAPSTSYSPPSSKYTMYTVGKGETLYSIATRNGMSVGELANLNGIGQPYTVYPGQELKIPSP